MTRPISLRLLVAVSLLFAAGCRRDQIRVYVAPADIPEDKVAAQGDDPHGDPHGAADKSEEPQIGWKLPDGWRETEPSSSMILASFTVPSDSGGKANVSIAHLPTLKGREPALVNMWREQVGLGSLPDAEAAKALAPAVAGGVPAQSFEVIGTGDGKPSRIVTVVLHRGEWSWFFKLAGDEPTVVAHKDEFLEFVKTVRFVGEETAAPQAAAPSAPPPPAAPAPPGPQPQPKWVLPVGWATLPAGQMQVAKFSVPEQNGAKAEVAVSIFPSDTGGTLANVNRWRAQLGMPPTDEAGLPASVQQLDGGGMVIDLTNDQRQIVGAIIPRGERWWFYKMLGDAPAVAAAKDAFVQFAKTAP